MIASAFHRRPSQDWSLWTILTNAVRRGMMGNLERGGWKDIPSLMLHRKDHYIHLLSLGTEEDAADRVFSYAAMLQHFRAGGLSLLTFRGRNGSRWTVER